MDYGVNFFVHFAFRLLLQFIADEGGSGGEKLVALSHALGRRKRSKLHEDERKHKTVFPFSGHLSLGGKTTQSFAFRALSDIRDGIRAKAAKGKRFVTSP